MLGVNFTKPLSCEQSLCPPAPDPFPSSFCYSALLNFLASFSFFVFSLDVFFSILFSAVGSRVCFLLVLQDIAFLGPFRVGLRAACGCQAVCGKQEIGVSKGILKPLSSYFDILWHLGYVLIVCLLEGFFDYNFQGDGWNREGGGEKQPLL